MGYLESLPIQRVRPVLYLPLWMGTFRDAAGNTSAVDRAGLYWVNNDGADAIRVSVNGTILVSNSDALESVLDSTLFIAGDFSMPAATSDFFNKEDAGGIQTRLWADNNGGGRMRFRDGVATVNRNLVFQDIKSFAVTHVNTGTPDLWLDGALDGPFSTNLTITPDDADLTLLGRYVVGSPTVAWATTVILWYPEVLPPAEVLSLHNWSQERFTPRKQWQGLDIPTLAGEAEEPVFLDNIQSARVSTGDETSGRLSNTDYFISTGTWQVNELNTGERFINCISGGIIYRENKFAYGTLEFEMFRAGANVHNIGFIADSVQAVGATVGYAIEAWGNGQVRLQQNTPNQNLFTAAAGYTAGNARIRWRITRSAGGVFSVYHRNPSSEPWALLGPVTGGANPVTDVTHTESQYFVYDLDPGDHIYLDRTYAGVVTPPGI